MDHAPYRDGREAAPACAAALAARCLRRLPLLSLLPLLACLLPAPVAAAPVLEEIVITARKREERLGRLPASAAVLRRDKLQAMDLDDLGGLAEFVPNLSFSRSAIGSQLQLRGIGSGNNQGFEQSVGQYVDGIHYARQPLLGAPFFDLARVEVLRGPQPVLFGRSSIAGALSLVSAAPTEDPEFTWSTLYESAAGKWEQNAVASGPLHRNLRVRLAWRGAREAGWLGNAALGRREPGRDEQALRLTLAARLGPRLDASLKIERNRFTSAGKPIEVLRPETAGLSSAGLSRAAPLFLPLTGRRSSFPERAAIRVDNVTLKLDRSLDGPGPLDGAALSLVGGLLSYDSRERCDCDFQSAALFEAGLRENYRQFSQELRLQSAGGGRGEWLIGAYVQASELRGREDFRFPRDSLFQDLAALPGLRAFGVLAGSGAGRGNRQRGEAAALFFQGSRSLGANLNLALGGRYTVETKTARRTLHLLDGALATDSDELALLYRGLLGIHVEELAGLTGPDGTLLPGHDLHGRRREARFSPHGALEWRPRDDLTAWLGLTRGYKAGGFDARGNTPASFEFGAEKVRSLEGGLRRRLWEDRLSVALSAFLSDYRDLQVSQFDGTLGFNVGNAGRTRLRGLELEGRWAPAAGVEVGYGWAWLDFRFRDFRSGNCHVGQVPDGVVLHGAALCDYGGKRGRNVPRQRLSLSLEHRRPLGAATLLAGLALNYQGPRNVHDSLDPAFRRPGEALLDFRLGLETRRWRLALIGRNLTGVRRLDYAADLPGAAALPASPAYYASPGPPRRFALEAAWRLGP